MNTISGKKETVKTEGKSDLLSKAPGTQKTTQNQASDLTLTLSNTEIIEFEKLAQETIERFVNTNGESPDETQEQKVISALVDFVISLYDHIATKTNHLPKNKRKIIKTLQDVLSNLESITLHQGVIEICKEKDKEKLPKLAHDLFLNIVEDESEIEKTGWKMQNLYKLTEIIYKMPYPNS